MSTEMRQKSFRTFEKGAPCPNTCKFKVKVPHVFRGENCFFHHFLKWICKQLCFSLGFYDKRNQIVS